MIVTQNEVKPKTYVIGITTGTYQGYINGQATETIFATNEAEAYIILARMIEAQHNADNNEPDWYYCEHCGRSVDAGQDCPDCIKVTSQDGNVFWLERLPVTEGMARQINEAVV